MWPFYFNKPVSRVLYLFEEVSIIYLAHPLLNGSNNLPWDQMRRDTSFPLFGLAPHRVYLVSLQHYLYLLSVALVLSSDLIRRGRALPAMLPFGARTFLTTHKVRCDRTVCQMQNYLFFNRIANRCNQLVITFNFLAKPPGIQKQVTLMDGFSSLLLLKG